LPPDIINRPALLKRQELEEKPTLTLGVKPSKKDKKKNDQ